MRPPRTAIEGQQLAPRHIGPITQTEIVRFAGAGGDFNALHHDPLVARDAGFGSVIAMGQMQAGMLAAFVSDLFGVENLREFSVRFTAPVRLGDHLDLVGTVLSVAPEPGARAVLELAVVAGGVTVVTGQATVTVAG